MQTRPVLRRHFHHRMLAVESALLQVLSLMMVAQSSENMLQVTRASEA
jgi:hypothetical protein